jgi:hypothetical protein
MPQSPAAHTAIAVLNDVFTLAIYAPAPQSPAEQSALEAFSANPVHV